MPNSKPIRRSTEASNARVPARPNSCPQSGEAQNGEQGYVLLAVLFMVAMVLIALSVAAPKVAADLERDREVELIHRGNQYRRAIQLYYKKFNAYPPNMEALEKTNEIRFLRKRYKDPITGKDQWHLIHFCENKSPTAMGFFGQPMGGTSGCSAAGTGPGGVGQSLNGQNGNSGSLFANNNGNNSGSNSLFGNNNGGGNSSSIFSSGTSTSTFGNTTNTNTSSTSTSSGNSTDPNAPNSGGATNSPNRSNDSTTQDGSSTDPNASTGGTSSSAFGGSSNGTGQTFGGGGIIGVESTSPKLAMLEYKKKKHFNEWEFVYDPQAERLTLGSSLGAIGQPMGGAGNGSQPVVNSPSLNNGPTNSPVSQPTPPTPQPQPQPTDPPQQ